MASSFTLNDSKAKSEPAAQSICLKCGLCCNGVIFADVKLLPQDSRAQVRSLGLAATKTSSANDKKPVWRFPQPCAAYSGCRCEIYDARPAYCRQFECLLLKKLNQGRVTRSEALRVIRSVLARARRVRRLLRLLGDEEESVALAIRFRRMSRNLSRGETGPIRAGLYGQLTVAFHNLRLVLDARFYPPPNQG